MAWIRVESSVARNRKFVKAGPAPSWLWLCGLAYCQEGLTDGFIPSEALNYLGVKNARQLASHLVTAGLWDVVDGGWQVHDYLEHNRSAAEISGIQQGRRDAGAKGGKASWRGRRAEANAEANAEAVAEPTQKTLLNPSTATATGTATGTATAGFARAPIHDTSHRKHAHCGRVCLPAALFGEFVRRRNHDGADREIRDWALGIEREWADKPDEPGEPFEFWKARYAEKWPVLPSVKPSTPAPWNCPHLERCANRQMCEAATILGRPLRPDTVAS